MLRGFEALTKVYGWWLFKLKGIDKCTGENFGGYKKKDGCCICKLNFDKNKSLKFKVPQNRYQEASQRQTSSKEGTIIICRACIAEVNVQLTSLEVFNQEPMCGYLFFQ